MKQLLEAGVLKEVVVNMVDELKDKHLNGFLNQVFRSSCPLSGGSKKRWGQSSSRDPFNQYSI